MTSNDFFPGLQRGMTFAILISSMKTPMQIQLLNVCQRLIIKINIFFVASMLNSFRLLDLFASKFTNEHYAYLALIHVKY